MNDTYPDSNSQELEDLLRQVDQLLEEPIPARTADADDIDILEFQPQGLDEPEEPMLYRNFSNNYGADVKNHVNGYGSGAPAEPPAQERVIPAYNADFLRDQPRDQPARLAREDTQFFPVQETPAPKSERPPKLYKQ